VRIECAIAQQGRSDPDRHEEQDLMDGLLLAQSDLPFVDRWGNAASVAGLVLTLIAATLWTVWRIKADTRRVVAKIGSQLLALQVSILVRLIADVRDAGRDLLWTRAIDRCQQARLIVVSLRDNPHLTRAERDAIRKADDDLRMIVQYIENNRLPPTTKSGNLPDQKKLALDRMVTLIGSIQGRLQNSAMEV
jgi:hypothetical protein